jgi:hypothetical protein
VPASIPELCLDDWLADEIERLDRIHRPIHLLSTIKSHEKSLDFAWLKSLEDYTSFRSSRAPVD